MGVFVLWTVLIVLLGFWQKYTAYQQVLQNASIQARLSLQKDMVYRLWAASHGGLYVPLSKSTPPNPYLKVAHRDVETLSGQKLTLMNPAYMMRQVQNFELGIYGHAGHLTSTRPLRPENAPDDWERRVLQKMEKEPVGDDDVVQEEQNIDGQVYLRMIKPMLVKQVCLKCHAKQGYKLGDLRGGISVSIPLRPLFAISHASLLRGYFADSLIWLLGIVGLMMASTRLKRVLQAEHAENLAREAARGEFRMLFDSIVDAVAIHDSAGNFVLVNAAYQRLLGYSPDEQLRMQVSQISSPDENVSVRKRVEQMQRQGHAVFTVRLLHKAGHAIPCEVNARLVEYRGQTMVLSIARDITERLQVAQERLEMELKLLETQKLESLGVLAGGIAHDFNNLLTVLSGNAEIALAELGDVDNEVRRSVDEILRASQLASKLVRQMLDYSGRGTFALKALCLNDLVQDTLDLVSRSLPKSTTVEFEPQTPLPLLKGDVGQLQQLVMNLLINASESYEGSDGRVVVRSERRLCGSEALSDMPQAQRAGLELEPGLEVLFVCLSIEDFGCGMNAEQIERIFEPFYTSKFTGRGLGMSAILGIVRGHKGAIRVRSKVNQGTLVEVLFPAVTDKNNDAN